MRLRIIIIVGFVLLTFNQQGWSQETSYLILEDIGAFKLHNQSRAFPDRKLRPITPFRKYNGSGGVLGASGHFVYDHNDVTYETGYDNSTVGMGVSVTVTQHSGSDSDKWLGHEIDEDFRNYFGIPGETYGPRAIDGQVILEDTVAGANYRWLSGNKVIMITYHDSQMEKPEPIEVIRAYLSKHPSTLPALTVAQLRSTTNKSQWIKDEMERRLWLGGKWFYQLQLGKVQQIKVIEQAVKSMNIFLDYRERYFDVKADGEKNLLASYLNANDGTRIKAKLDEYKKWWAAELPPFIVTLAIRGFDRSLTFLAA